MTPPPGASSKNVRFVSRCDQGGRPDGVQVIVHKGHAFIGHMFSDGFSVVDVRDPLHPKTVAFVAAPKNTRSPHLQIHGDVLLAVNGPNIWAMQQYASQQDYYAKSLIDSVHTEQPFAAGLRVFDISKPASPREIAFLAMPGFGAHRLWWVGGLTIHDLSDPPNPKLLSHRNYAPPFGGGAHTPLPLPGRKLLVLADAATSANCANGIAYTWLIDVREPSNPVSIATLPTPAEEDFCAKGAKFGPHNLHENRPGSMQTEDIVFATYHNAGLRIYDIRDAFQPKQIGYFVPPAPEKIVDQRPNPAKVIQSCDVFVDKEGLMYLTDTNAASIFCNTKDTDPS
ncbi:MAG: hypothetical protein HYX37_18370 [Rhizobiales bacterium]|nr:hypothetical protein [Hyphomicrobiales bacterium]